MIKCIICGMVGSKPKNMKRRCNNSREIKYQMVQGGHCRFEEIPDAVRNEV